VSFGQSGEREAKRRKTATRIALRRSANGSEASVQFHSGTKQQHIALERRERERRAEMVKGGRSGQSLRRLFKLAQRFFNLSLRSRSLRRLPF
jgi:hypothetical protein